ncbi:hypothetical protein EDB84DRAFT_1563134 [Lactarius hengduanensis]|nr:hypothetical protein EDB84DRAFT_1563134 [Lactarius hengduanensis]
MCSAPILCRPFDTSTTDPNEGLKSGKTTKRFQEPHKILTRGESHMHATTINSFPDNVLLEIFDFYRRHQDLCGSHFYSMWDWHRLAHVCPRWRRIILSSPRRLNLQLLCTHGTPVRNNLVYWPPFPIIIDYCTYRGTDDRKSLTPGDEDNVVAALEDSARVIGKPFSALTHLWLTSNDDKVPTLPDEFLGLPAPSLRVVHLEGISFPALPRLLSSALGLVDLRLLDIPRDHHISPGVLVSSLAALTGLRTLLIGFRSPTPSSRTIRQDPMTRIGLPSLTTFGFHGVKEYLEDLVAQIDTPQLDYFRISYFNRLDFQVPQLSRFIVRTQSLYLARFKRARVDFGANNVYVSLYCEREELLESHFSLQISCQGLDWQVSHVAQTLSQSAALLSNVGDLSIDARELSPGGKDYMDDTEWLDLLRPFTAVETLHVSRKLAGHVARGLKGVTGDMVIEILPSLYSLSLEDEPLTSVERFVEVRRLSGRPVTIVNEFFERLKSPPEPERVPYSSALNFELRPAPPTAKVSGDSHISCIGTCSYMRDAATPPRDARSRRNDYHAYWGADDASSKSLTPGDEDDVIAALEYPDRVRNVGISVTRSLLGKMAAAMQESFPILTHLWLSSDDGNVPVLPKTFLGGSAPRLRVAHLEGIPFPAFPTLLSLATDLVNLQLLNISKTGFVSPDAMVAGLTTLTMLETLSIEFQSPTPLPYRKCPPPSMRVPFPSFVTFNFRGDSEYLEGLVARIDAPLLKNKASISSDLSMRRELILAATTFTSTLIVTNRNNLRVILFFKSYAKTWNGKSRTWLKYSANVFLLLRSLPWEISPSIRAVFNLVGKKI